MWTELTVQFAIMNISSSVGIELTVHFRASHCGLRLKYSVLLNCSVETEKTGQCANGLFRGN